MPATRKTLGPVAGTGANATILGPVTVMTRLTGYHLCNTSTSAAAAGVALNGTTATPANCIVGPSHQVAAAGIGTGDEDRYCSHVLQVGGSVQVNLATSVTITIDYEELTAG
jgi:hypothetical protein